MSIDGAAQATWRFDKDRHVKYWKRCLKTFLPEQYTSNDSNRMYLAYLIISALEVLDSLQSSTSQEGRAGYIDWIYHCQHPRGGFRMWPGTDFGERATEQNVEWDPAHVPATYFALTSLLTLGDDLSRVQREQTLQWLSTMQREDGSFGETKVNRSIEGGRDPRFGYCAAGSRYILLNHGSKTSFSNTKINEETLAQSICSAQSYDGGIADTAFNEPHAGYTFCALGALALTDQLDASKTSIDIAAVTRWLVERQTNLVDPDGFLDTEFVGRVFETSAASSATPLQQSAANTVLHSLPTNEHAYPNAAAGMNGRLNKVADTCYCWWVGASLNMLGQGHLIDRPALRRYLLQLTQHPYMGGFTKFPNDKYADIYHSFMGLVALSITSTSEERQKDSIKEWDAEMCISKDVKYRTQQG